MLKQKEERDLRQPYAAPKAVEYGSVQHLTQGED